MKEIYLLLLKAIKELTGHTSIQIIENLIDAMLSTTEIPKKIDGGGYFLANGRPHSPDDNTPQHEFDTSFYKKGFKHRLGGPALTTVRGTKRYYLIGLLHNSNGMAEESIDKNYYYLFGKRLSKEEYMEMINE